MDPILVQFGPFAIRWYGVLIVAGALLAGYIGALEAKRKGDDSEYIWDALAVVLITGLLGAREEDVFPAHHRINTAARLTSVDGFAVEELHHVQDINRTNTVVFSCLLAYHLLTRLPGLARFRSNLIVLLRKT